LILLEQRAGEDVAQQEHNAEYFIGFDAARNDAFGKVACVSLQRFHAAGFQNFHVVVVNRGGFREDFLLAHGGEQLSVRNALCPLLPQLRPVLPQVRHNSRSMAALVSPADCPPSPEKAFGRTADAVDEGSSDRFLRFMEISEAAGERFFIIEFISRT
jgi:hypothetical protein